MVGIRFADPRTVNKMLHVKTAANRSFTIPAGDSNYEVKATYTFASDSLLLSLTPHMHLRGRSFLFEADYPDGTSEILLSVPNFEFGWQLRYLLAEPKLMPKGAHLRCTAHFDNSSENLGNPDPTTAVRYGEQSWEEMMEGNFSWIEPGTDVACKALVALSLTAGSVGGALGRESRRPAEVTLRIGLSTTTVVGHLPAVLFVFSSRSFRYANGMRSRKRDSDDVGHIEIEIVREFDAHDADATRHTLREYREYRTGRTLAGDNFRLRGRTYFKTNDERDVLPLGKGKYRILADPPIEVVADE